MSLSAQSRADLNRYFGGTFIEIETKEPKPKRQWVYAREFGEPSRSLDNVTLSYETMGVAKRYTIVLGDNPTDGGKFIRGWPELRYYFIKSPIPQAVYLYRHPAHSSKKGFLQEYARLFNPLAVIPRNFQEAVVKTLTYPGLLKQMLAQNIKGMTLTKACKLLYNTGLSLPLDKKDFCLSIGMEDIEGVFDLWYRNVRVGEYYHDKKNMVVANEDFRQEVFDNFKTECNIPIVSQ